MDILDLLRSAQGGALLQNLANSHGISTEQLDSILNSVVPALSNRIERNTLSRAGLADTIDEASRPEHAKVMSGASEPASPLAAQAGIGALDTIFGSKDASRSVAAQAAMSSGIEQALIQKLLPILASLVMAALSKGMQGGLGDILKKLPDLTGVGAGGDSGSASSFPPTSRRGRPVEPPRDEDADPPDADTGADPTPRDEQPDPRQSRRQTNPASPDYGGLGDVLKKFPGFPGSQSGAPIPVPGRSSPQSDSPFGGGGGLPIPGDRIPGVNSLAANPFGNLADVIRRGGPSIDGAPLHQVVRNSVGSTLGFQSQGIASWIFRLIVLRWGWGFIQRLLGRALAGR